MIVVVLPNKTCPFSRGGSDYFLFDNKEIVGYGGPYPSKEEANTAGKTWRDKYRAGETFPIPPLPDDEFEEVMKQLRH